MSIANLTWAQVSEGVRFNLRDASEKPIDPWSWGLYDVRVEDRPGSVAPLLGLLEEGEASAERDQGLSITYAQIAAFDAIQLRQLGLAPAAPYRLNIRGQGILTSPQFRFQYQLIGQDGRGVPGIQREGTLLTVGSRRWTLLNPLFALIEGMEAFNKLPPQDMDGRFLKWAELKKLLPEDTEVDQQLRSMNIVRADAFTLDLDDAGSFDPILLARPEGGNLNNDESPPAGKPVLPEAHQQELSRRFRGFATAQGRYIAGGGWFVVVPKTLRGALDVTREMQSAPVAQRQAFIANPQAVLKERLQGEVNEADIELLFEETPAFVSERIQRLGEWHPKLCAYVLPTGQQWLPPEELILGVTIGDAIYEITVQDVPKLRKDIEEALQAGQTEIDYQGQKIPVNEETLSTLGQFVEHREPARDASSTSVPDQPRPVDQVPIIIDNIDGVGFVPESRPARGEMGGIPGVLRNLDLFEHQKEGLKWLQEHWAAGSPGALLADDMGLGKTLQALAFMAWVQEQMDMGLRSRRPFLVVAPTGLLKNWQDEADRHLAAPGLGHLFRAYGADLRELARLTRRQRLDRFSQVDWVLTTYETLRDKILYFTGLEWGVAVFDEAQKIKNPASRLTEMAKSIKADFQLMLTGTPVENRLADLWSIMDAATPGLLGSLKNFHQCYEKIDDNNVDAVASLKVKLVEETRPPVMLRRLKEDHLPGLPDKHHHVIKVVMPPQQANAYNQQVAKASDAAGKRGAMLEILQGLRSISLLAEPIGVEGLTDDIVKASARLTALLDILKRVSANREKALIFLESLRLQEALAPYLQRHFQLPRLPLRISGSVSGDVRKSHVDTFQNQPQGQFDVMLLSPRAGGVGLTVTAANHIIHLSRWWNPAVEDQCTDRAYRIGQTKTVQVYYPMAIHPHFGDHSFDVNLHQLLEHKRKLSYELLLPPQANDKDLGDLFRKSTEA